ncbi:unnamed protein product [Closterium sp. NIES-54]
MDDETRILCHGDASVPELVMGVNPVLARAAAENMVWQPWVGDLCVVRARDYELHSLEFSTAFLQGSLHEEIWLRRPPGFTGSFPAGTQWSLRRPVYGLRQAPREWHDTLRMTLAALGFAPSTANPSLFQRTDATLLSFYVLVYVDDLVFGIADTEALAHMKCEVQKRHTCTNLGELTSYLGLRITWDRAQRTITLTQSHMVQQVLQRFGFTYSSPQSTPLPTGDSLSAPPSDESVEPSGPYPELVGCLMYLMTCTRPDLAYPLSLLVPYVAPGRHRKVHWDAAKRVLRYLCSTSGMGLVLGGRARVVLTGHTDASWVDDLATQRSSQGYTFSLGSGSVSGRSTRSSSVLSSSCEAEIYAGAMAAQELCWLTYLQTDLGEAPRSPPVLYVDNKAMLALCQEHRLEHRTKHIALRYFLARELQQRGQLRLAYVASQANTANVFTKALQPCDHQHFCTVLGLAAPYHPALPTPAAVPPVPVNPAASTAAADPALPVAPALDAPMVGAAPAGAVASQPVVSATADDPGQVAVSVAPAPPTAPPPVPAPDFHAVPDPAPLAAVPPAQHQLSPGRRQHRPHSPVAQDERETTRRRHDSPPRRGSQANWAASRGGRGGWWGGAVVVASQSNSPRIAPAHASRPPSALDEPAPPLPQSAVPPPLAPSASTAARGNRMRLPWVPPVAGMEFVTAAGGQVTAQYPSLLPVAPSPPAVSVPVQSLVGPLPSAEVPEASLGQLWRLSEGLRAVHLIQVYGHAALSQGAHLDPGPRDECLDVADRLAELLAPVLAALRGVELWALGSWGRRSVVCAGCCAWALPST